MALFSLSEWQEAIFARIVDKVGTRTYWEDWARDVADIAAALITWAVVFRMPGHALQHDQSQGVEVGRGADRVAADLFGGQV